MIGHFTEDRIYQHNETVIVSDLHLPDGTPLEDRWNSVLKMSNSYSTLILNGDFITGFPPSKKELSMLEQASSHFNTVRYHLGNHEEMTTPAQKDFSPQDLFGSQVTEFRLEDLEIDRFTVIDESILVTHGHRVMHDMPLENINTIIIGHIHPSYPEQTPVALSAPFRFNTDISVYVCPAFGFGISNFSYKDQNRMNDFIESIPESTILKSFAEE